MVHLLVQAKRKRVRWSEGSRIREGNFILITTEEGMGEVEI